MSTRSYKQSHIACFITCESVCIIQDGALLKFKAELKWIVKVQGGSNMTGTDLCVNKPHCAAAVRP